jgi:hypothetical protein
MPKPSASRSQIRRAVFVAVNRAGGSREFAVSVLSHFDSVIESRKETGQSAEVGNNSATVGQMWAGVRE